MAEKVVKIGLVGFGTVGAGVVKILLEQADSIAAKTGIRMELACVVDNDISTERPIQLPDGLLTDDLNKLLDNESIQIGLELVGGTGAAHQIQIQLMESGKDVVTANKALLAEHGNELYETAHKNNRCIAFEGACAGGVPIISGLRTGLAGNDIISMYGIVNGTCNYILTNMTNQNKDFSEALAQAQSLGYAEADPTLDVNGMDSAHKLAILASIAFGYEIKLEDIFVEGIEFISKDDICYGGEMGYVLKLLAIGQKDNDDKVSLRVHPSFISAEHPIARVEGPFNAISLFGNAVGQVMFYGRGAGMMPTAGAVVADIIDVAMGNSIRNFRHLHLKPRDQIDGLIDNIDNLVSRFYIRIMCKDQHGVIAKWSKILANHQISISGALQHEGQGPDNTVPVVITTYPTQQKNISGALLDMEKLDAISGKPVCIRIVDIPEDKD
jgi:homoserine dehydrogenase